MLGNSTTHSRVVEPLLQEIRELFVYSYRVIYHVGDHSALVAAVIHGRRELAPFVERFTDDA